jgi:hypothetical protein
MWWFERQFMNACPECIGERRARAQILEDLHQLLEHEVNDVAGDTDRARGIEMAIARIKEETNE